MAIITEIGGKDYKFELSRASYKLLLADKEYAKVQDDIIGTISNGEDDKEKMAKEYFEKVGYTNTLLSTLISNEKIFYYSLLKYQPDMTKEEASELMDTMIDEDGSMEYVNELVEAIMESFTQGATTEKANKKPRVLKKI